MVHLIFGIALALAFSLMGCGSTKQGEAASTGDNNVSLHKLGEIGAPEWNTDSENLSEK